MIYQIKLMQERVSRYEYVFTDLCLSLPGGGSAEPLRVVGRNRALDLAEILNGHIKPALPGSVMIEQVSDE